MPYYYYAVGARPKHIGVSPQPAHAAGRDRHAVGLGAQRMAKTFNAEDFGCYVDGALGAFASIFNHALNMDPNEPVALTAIVRADAPEIGELYINDDTLPALCEHDWCVTARTVDKLAQALRALL